ncbi:MAG TPA: adenosine deaminase [Myxococcota bacterium]|nr:adenosine deaminase [Myxococcota bacterium]
MKHVARKLIEQLPKTDLHCHFDGSIRIETMIDLAKRNNVSLFSYEPSVLMEHMKYGRVRRSLEEYLAGFEPLIAVLQHADDIERAFFEVCEDAAAENVWHLELRYCPYLHTKKNLTSKEVVEACIKASERAERAFNISVKQILCGLKNYPHASVFAIAELAAAFRDSGVVGFDLAGPETGYPIKHHQAAIFWAKKHHLFITLHAGESCGPDSISEALHEGFAHRVGHGTSLTKDPALLDYVADHRIGVEACPISNWHTGAVKSLSEHPIKIFLDHGVRVSINTDNRLCSDTTITEEIMAVMENLDITMDQIRKLLINGFKSAFLPYRERARLLLAFNAAWERLVG